MHETNLRNGVLFYLAIEAKQFVILGDEGINKNGDEYIQKDWKILTTNNSDITFGGKLKAALGSKENKTSLIVRTCLTGECTGGEVTFDNKVGFEFIDIKINFKHQNEYSTKFKKYSARIRN